jgi:hypothetical protein
MAWNKRQLPLAGRELINYSCATSCIISLHPKNDGKGDKQKNEIFVDGYWEGYSPRRKETRSLISQRNESVALFYFFATETAFCFETFFF